MTNANPILRLLAGILLILSLAACAGPQPGQGSADSIYDPFEDQNRRVHEFNRQLDRRIVRPAGTGYASAVPTELQDSVGNFAENLGEPADVVNAVLQGDLRGATISTGRFVINTLLGFGGLFDVASDFKVPEHQTDFGETLHVWGVKEGAYLELPVLGPSTERDAFGSFVDLFTNPLTYILPSPEDSYGTIAGATARLGDRGRFADTVDSILYESADSYAQARLIYLQNRRFELGQETEDQEIDPFAIDTEGF